MFVYLNEFEIKPGGNIILNFMESTYSAVCILFLEAHWVKMGKFRHKVIDI